MAHRTRTDRTSSTRIARSRCAFGCPRAHLCPRPIRGDDPPGDTKEERDRSLSGFFRLEPQWYLFYYLTARLGLRTGEVYAIAHRQVRSEPPQLVVDQAVQRGTKTREARLVSRKNDEAYVLDLTEDVLAAVDWHVSEGYARPEFSLFEERRLPSLHRQPRAALEARAAEARSPNAKPSQGGAAFGREPSSWLGCAAAPRRSAETSARSARARAPRQPGVNGHSLDARATMLTSTRVNSVHFAGITQVRDS
jgi:hypothetical protein